MKPVTQPGHHLQVNVPVTERWLSLAAGSLLLGAGSQRPGLLRSLAGGYLLFRAFTGHCAAYSAIGKHTLPNPVKNINIKATLHIDRPRMAMYEKWKQLENLPLFMQHLKSVKVSGNGKSKWKAWLPGYAGIVSWKARIVKDEPGKLLGWSSTPASLLANAGKVEFRDHPLGGTDMRVVITYRAPLGAVGAGLAHLLTPAFEKMIRDDIENFKLFVETGKKVTDAPAWATK